MQAYKNRRCVLDDAPPGKQQDASWQRPDVVCRNMPRDGVSGKSDDRTILQPSLESGSEVSTALHEKTVKQPGVWPVQGQKPELRVIKLLSYSDLGDRIGYEIVAVVQCSTKYPAMRALSLLSRREKI